MNLTITQNRPNKQPPNNRTQQQSPIQLSPNGLARPDDFKRKQCNSFFFMSCLNAHPTEPSERSEENELFLHRLPPSNLQAEPRRKISLSINPNNSSFHTPRLKADNKESSSGKQTVLPSPMTSGRSGEIGGIKLTLNSGSPSEIKGMPEGSESKQILTRNSIEPPQQQAQSRQSKRPSMTQKIEPNNNYTPKVEHSSEKNIVEFYQQGGAVDCGQNYSFLEKSEPSQKQIEDVMNGISWKEKLKNRRGIGQYAKTIKSLQASEQQSDIESIVIERGMPRGEVAMVAPLSRGSTKECPNEQETLRRGYGSVGHELHKAHLKSKFSRQVDQAIEEDLYDYEI